MQCSVPLATLLHLLSTLVHLWLLYCTSCYFAAPLATLLHLWLRYCLLYYRVFFTQELAALQRLLYCSSFVATRRMRVSARRMRVAASSSRPHAPVPAVEEEGCLRRTTASAITRSFENASDCSFDATSVSTRLRRVVFRLTRSAPLQLLRCQYLYFLC